MRAHTSQQHLFKECLPCSRQWDIQVSLLVIKGEKKDKYDSPVFKALAAPLFCFVSLLTSVICLFSDFPLLICQMECSNTLHLWFLGLLISKDLYHHSTSLVPRPHHEPYHSELIHLKLLLLSNSTLLSSQLLFLHSIYYHLTPPFFFNCGKKYIT